MSKLAVGQAPPHLAERKDAMRLAAEFRPVGSFNLSQVSTRDILYKTLSKRELAGRDVVIGLNLYCETLERYYERTMENRGFMDLISMNLLHPYIVSLQSPSNTLRFIGICGILEKKVMWGGRGAGLEPRIMVLIDEEEGKQLLLPGRTWIIWKDK